MSPDQVVDVVTPQQLQTTLQANLREFGLTLDELMSQAERKEFSSERVRALWLAMQHLAERV